MDVGEKIKSLVVRKENKNNKKTIENLTVFLVLLIITVISIKLIWKKDNKSTEESSTVSFTNSINKNIETSSVNFRFERIKKLNWEIFISTGHKNFDFSIEFKFE